MWRLIFLLILFFICSCGINLDLLIKREANLKKRNDFNSYLALEYLEYSRDLANKYNWRDSDYFAKKALQAANNKEVFPEVPESWDLDTSQIEEASLARTRLELLITPGTKQDLPIQLAHLILLYDCWISKEKQPWQLPFMSKCKVRFFDLINEMEKHIKENVKPKQEIQVKKIQDLKFKKFDISFDLNSYKFTEKADMSLAKLLNYLQELNGDYKLLLVGGADRTGKKLYNQYIARQRVIAVKDRLIKNGVPEQLITIKSFGEDDPQMASSPNSQNKYNRMVSIYALKGKDSIDSLPLPLIKNYVYKQELLEEIQKRDGF